MVSKTLPLAAFLRNYPIRSFEVTGVAKSMDETEYEIDFAQVGQVNGMEKWFDSKIVFKKPSMVEAPWAKMKIVRCRAMGEGAGSFEMVDEKGTRIEIKYQEATVTVPDDYDSLYRR